MDGCPRGSPWRFVTAFSTAHFEPGAGTAAPMIRSRTFCGVRGPMRPAKIGSAPRPEKARQFVREFRYFAGFFWLIKCYNCDSQVSLNLVAPNLARWTVLTGPDERTVSSRGYR